MYVSNYLEFKWTIIDEIHKMPYLRHLGYQEMVDTTTKKYIFPRMKKNVLEYIAKCMECHWVKVEYQHLVGLLQPFPLS